MLLHIEFVVIACEITKKSETILESTILLKKNATSTKKIKPEKNDPNRT